MIPSSAFTANFFGAMAGHYDIRASRAIESERPTWAGLAAANRCASKLNDARAVDLVLKLQRTHAGNPAFIALCENLRIQNG